MTQGNLRLTAIEIVAGCVLLSAELLLLLLTSNDTLAALQLCV